MYKGYTFSTGNSTIATLHAGSTFVKNADGSLTVTFAAAPPKPVFNEGDRVYVNNKDRYATIVRMTDVQGLSNGLPPKTLSGEAQQFYIGDANPTVVRIARESDLKKLS